MDKENIFESYTNSISGKSEYSDVYDNYDQIYRINNKEVTNSTEIVNDNYNNNKDLIIKKESNTSKNESFPIPEDTKENIIEENNNIHLKRYENIDDSKEENKSNNFENYNNSEKFEEELYSIKNDSSSIFKDNNKKLDKTLNEKEVDTPEINIYNKKRAITLDKNKEPLDNTFDDGNLNINDNLYMNLNRKKESKPINKTFKKNKTFNYEIFKKPLISGTIEKGTNSIINNVSNNIGKNNKNSPYFDFRYILKKAVVLNGKKGTNIENSLDKINKKNVISENDINNINNIPDDKFPINNIQFKGIKIDEINIKHFKNLRRIDIERKNKKSKNKYIKTLIELQNFYIDETPIWVIKISPNGRYLAGGSKSGKIKIHEIMGYTYPHYKLNYNKKNILEYFQFINQVPYKTLERHKSDIIDLSWSPFYPNLLLSASLDHFVCLWDISLEGNNCLINEYEHDDIVTSVSFNPYIKNYFVSGCLDTYIRVWKFNYFDNNMNVEDNYNINNNTKITNENSEANIFSSFKKKNKKNRENKEENALNNNTFDDMNRSNAYLEQINKDSLDYLNILHKITSLAYFPDGSKIGVGTEKGKIYVYNTFPRINYSNNFFVSKKAFGFFHGGKKVTNIQFIDKIHAIITTSDSRIRLVDMIAGRIICQYKGYANKCSMTRAFTDLSDDVIIVGGEDGYCYVWKLIEGIKNKNYIRFKPFSKELIECSLIAHEKCYINYMQKVLKLTNKILILSIIINGTSKGRLEILLNIEESI